MNVRKQFDLDIYKLSNKKHYYEFDIDDRFFESFDDSLIQHGKLRVNLILDKTLTMIVADFSLKGIIELICDRSLDEFDYPVETEKQLIFKFGDQFEELSDEIILIPRESQKLDVSQYIYEFVGLEVPMKKLHPRYLQEEDDEAEQTKFIYSTKKVESKEDYSEDPENIWEKLKNLKDNNN